MGDFDFTYATCPLCNKEWSDAHAYDCMTEYKLRFNRKLKSAFSKGYFAGGLVIGLLCLLVGLWLEHNK